MGRRRKVVYLADAREVIYDETRWEILREKRRQALEIMKVLRQHGLEPIVHGSIARGDVRHDSDIDIVIPYMVNPSIVEAALENGGFEPIKKAIVQATPTHVIKAHIYLDELICVTFPLTELRPREREFYKFGGELTYEQLLRDMRVPGVDKRLMLIEPTDRGHIESSIIGREVEVAERLGVSLDIIRERIYVLTRRDRVGRTGVYLKLELPGSEPIQPYIKSLASTDPAIRKRLLGFAI
ncbi:MAG: nucleotidyltransferase [Thermoprotei archaeon]|nr:MAG: nucleotidyltransferase [Thermoprotei archaeon]